MLFSRCVILIESLGLAGLIVIAQYASLPFFGYMVSDPIQALQMLKYKLKRIFILKHLSA